MMDEKSAIAVPDVTFELNAINPSHEYDGTLATADSANFDEVADVIRNSPPPRRPNRSRPLARSEGQADSV